MCYAGTNFFREKNVYSTDTADNILTCVSLKVHLIEFLQLPLVYLGLYAQSLELKTIFRWSVTVKSTISYFTSPFWTTGSFIGHVLTSFKSRSVIATSHLRRKENIVSYLYFIGTVAVHSVPTRYGFNSVGRQEGVAHRRFLPTLSQDSKQCMGNIYLIYPNTFNCFTIK